MLIDYTPITNWKLIDVRFTPFCEAEKKRNSKFVFQLKNRFPSNLLHFTKRYNIVTSRYLVLPYMLACRSAMNIEHFEAAKNSNQYKTLNISMEDRNQCTSKTVCIQHLTNQTWSTTGTDGTLNIHDNKMKFFIYR